MSTDSLIANIEYDTKMDRNINFSLNSNEGTIIPEDLSYAITINKSNEELHQSRNICKNKYLLIINMLIFLSSIIILCILYL
jgi:hypothetical protein